MPTPVQRLTSAGFGERRSSRRISFEPRCAPRACAVPAATFVSRKIARKRSPLYSPDSGMDLDDLVVAKYVLNDNNDNHRSTQNTFAAQIQKWFTLFQRDDDYTFFVYLDFLIVDRAVENVHRLVIAPSLATAPMKIRQISEKPILRKTQFYSFCRKNII